MSSRPDPITPAEATDETVRNRLEDAQDSWYGDSAFFGAMAHRPAIFEHIVRTFEAFGQGPHVDAALLELMRLKIAERHQCAYCATVRTLEVQDAVQPKEDAVFGEIDPDGLTRREYLAVSLAAHLANDPHRLTDEFFADLQAVFTDAEIIEILLFGSLEVGLDRFCIALELQPTAESAYPDDLTYPSTQPRPKTE